MKSIPITSQSAAVSTPSELKDASAMIAADLNHMSVVERESVFFDVHGVSGAVEESSEMLRRSLAELDLKVSKIRNKEAYDIAEAQNPRYVTDQDFRLQFLRSVKFDTSWAAKKMVQFFEMKLELFGDDRLTKDITLDDLDDKSISCLESGLCTTLPLKDRAGRAIVCWTVKLRGKFSIESKVSIICGKGGVATTTRTTSQSAAVSSMFYRSFEYYSTILWPLSQMKT